MVMLLTNIYRVILVLLSIYILFRWKKVDKATKIVCCLVWLGLVTEATAKYCVIKTGNNYPVYNISFYVEFVLVCLYFNYSIAVFKKWGTGIYIAAAGVVLGIINTVFLQPLMTVFNANLLLLECFTVVCLSLFSIYRLIRIDDDNLQLQKKTHFWLPCVLLFYQTSTLWSWGLYDKLGNTEIQKAHVLDIIVVLTNIITYLSFAFLFFLYPKMKRVHA